MARAHQRSIRIEEEHVPLLESLPKGTVNTLFNELLRLFKSEPALQKQVVLMDERFRDWKMPVDAHPDVETAPIPSRVEKEIAEIESVTGEPHEQKPLPAPVETGKAISVKQDPNVEERKVVSVPADADFERKPEPKSALDELFGG